MPKGYWIIRVDVADAELYKAYMAATPVPLRNHGARFLARSGRTEAVEGVGRARNVVIEFPSFEAALACWNSPEYQAARELRRSVSTMEVVIIEGYEGAQP